MPPEPLTLAFDTAAAHCAAVLFQGPNMLARTVDPMSKGQAEHLLPMLETLLQSAGCSWADLDTLGVGIGPGNFTGIRISVAAARGLSLSLNRPCIGISRLDAIAYGSAGPQTVVVDARQNRVYHQSFDNGVALSDVALVALDSLAGDQSFLSDGPLDLGSLSLISAEDMIRNTGALVQLRRNDEHPRPAPLYVRAPDAALPSEQPPRILP
ncbi:tRNA (adenosine(37)-N6)-threonylcarbamoyltransferase complex dimerization subunit type 1 TsaB [Neptunicoccus sediminis]|uniref:tRNA (adenosine(37)-N6)-threonylcarbamoyltransferase complex dimerization subunit type 1 TsaB n=1 Tax=Neptunicoccus sediminis TaxID=1892596 RepID=UPI000845E49C|nr:tRNA (adenosine(37)-N6)-threonylcarbamoyltransferase complex dimerization subunit type 1 TsaB [Neptunicoccus sediminis]